jgi:hypothetical protein
MAEKCFRGGKTRFWVRDPPTPPPPPFLYVGHLGHAGRGRLEGVTIHVLEPAAEVQNVLSHARIVTPSHGRRDEWDGFDSFFEKAVKPLHNFDASGCIPGDIFFLKLR